MFAKTFIAVTLATAALAKPFTTAPVAATTYAAGQDSVVRWQDDNTTPTLADFGPAIISIYVGNAQQQTRLQTLNESVDVSKVNEITFKPDPTIGPNGNEYFIRYESISLKDPAQPQFPALAFSAKFTLSGMTGTFSDAVKSQIAGQSTAPLQGATTSGSSASTTTSKPAATTTSSSASKPASTTTSSTASPTSKTGAATMTKAGWTGALLGALVGMTMF